MEMRVQSAVESFRQGTEGLLEEFRVLRRPWGFLPASVTVPVRLWHGEEDSIVGTSFANEMARRLPRPDPIYVPNAGHNLLFSHWPDILAQLSGHARSTTVEDASRSDAICRDQAHRGEEERSALESPESNS
jgi:pimeloyl-ACP methyl ester carboxylesterase